MDKFLHYYPEVPRKIVEVLARTLLALAPSTSLASSSSVSRGGEDEEDHSSSAVASDEKRLLLSLLLCLGEWVMRMPR